MNILDKIVARKREEIAFSKSKISVEELKNSEFFGRKTFALKKSVKARNGMIAECKRQSPSKGIINDKVAPLEVVTKYEEFGASGISILTDKVFFGGSFEDILSVRNSVNIPILRKDFMVDEYQFYEGKGTYEQNAVVLSNAAKALQNTGKFENYKASLAAAKESLESGKALKCLNKLVQSTM